ncbi:hypothetical protein ACHHYP_16315 [Achlya hypogyna]|uniref:Chromo domain-containing protein n=1 Tax=Achlya hypogyna TaxID=1202772 RepID=A0A1V9Y956_ACHHY|nr:hypothetical protein ACHHYP_16315 [Achlya hypogyna]
MRDLIHEFAAVIAPLQRRLDEHLKSKKREKHKAAWGDVKHSLAKAVELAHPHPDAELQIIIVNQIRGFDEVVSVCEQQHEFVHCAACVWNGAHRTWSVIEPEAYLIAKACGHMLMRPFGFRMYTDHNHLTSSTSLLPIADVGRYSCTILHIITGNECQAHVSRLKPLVESSYEITQEIREHVSEQGIELCIRDIRGVRYNRSDKLWEIECLWEGHEGQEASWEKFTSIATDAPAVARKFVEQVAGRKTQKSLLDEPGQL